MNRRTLLRALAAVPLPLAVSAPSWASGDPALRLRDLYNNDLTVSDVAKARQGTRVTVEGFMAPPLKAESRFFVLTQRPLSMCPFCDAGADWPDNILAVYTKRVLNVESFNVRLAARGTLELGDHMDPQTGFFSRLRISGATYDRA